MTTKIYHNPRCSKSRQTLALLSENEMDVEIIEYLKTPPSRKELSEIIKMLGIKPRDLLRKGEKEYKEAGLSNKELSDKQIIDAMLEHPKLIERPIVIKDGQARIGRPPELILEIV
ncbi:MAG: arsenate reductase (glutaredoxin) [Gammaproteobacteria bacterium]|nr:arsenate reductase (glutaredoxin) [Gammaproteobacteria bacterium]NNJ92608.1 arsenate reductase (glutaredoxin) [Gammaproteobacteria bacterium]